MNEPEKSFLTDISLYRRKKFQERNLKDLLSLSLSLSLLLRNQRALAFEPSGGVIKVVVQSEGIGF